MGLMKRRIPQELKAYKSQLFFGLSGRQVLCAVGALAFGVPTGIICSQCNVSTDMTSMICMAAAAPFGLLGWVTYNNMPFEVYAKKIYEFYFAPQKRKWQYIPPEVKVHNALMELEYEELAAERKKELADEKARLKAEKKQAKIDAKEAKKAERAERKAQKKKKKGR